MGVHRNMGGGGKFVTAVEAIYAAAPDPSYWPEALQAIADVFDDVGALLSYGRDDGGFGAIGSRSLDSLLLEYTTTFDGDDLRAKRGGERGVYLGRDAVSDLDVVSREEMETHPFYKMLARHGLKYFGAIPISPDPRVIASLVVQRSLHKQPFTEFEMDTLTQLGRHAEKSLRLGVRLLDSELTKTGLGEALTRVGIGVFVLDSLGRVLFQNPAGQRLLGHGLNIANEQLSIGPCPEREVIEAAIRQTVGSDVHRQLGDPKPMLIERPGRDRALAIYVLPVRKSEAPAQQMLAHARAIVLVIDPADSGPADPALVRDVLGLTLGEARVAALVGSGLPPREAAAKLGITEETARTALKRVFSKAGVSRQSELTALLTRLVLR